MDLGLAGRVALVTGSSQGIGRAAERMVTGLPAQAIEMSAQVSPLSRLPSPDEVATAIVYLCSGANSAITGEIVRVGGGAT